MSQEDKINNLESKIGNLQRELAEVKKEKLNEAENKESERESSLSRRDFLKKVAGGAAGLGAAAMVPSVSGFTFRDNEPFRFGNLSTDESNLKIEDQGLEMYGNDIKNAGTVKADKVQAGNLTDATAVSSESDLVEIQGGYGYIPRGTTLNISEQFRPESKTTLDIYGTLRQADNADIGGPMINTFSNDNITIRVLGTIDGNYQNQSVDQTRLLITYNDGEAPKNNRIVGNGQIKNMQGTSIVNDSGGVNTAIRGLKFTGWKPNELANRLITWNESNGKSKNLKIQNIVFDGESFQGKEGDGDIISGVPSECENMTVEDCDFLKVPRRSIQGPTSVINNNFYEPANPGGGGDVIAGSKIVMGNNLIGTYNDIGDNGIVMRTPGICVGNYVEGFSNNGILISDGGEQIIISNNYLVDNDRNSNNESANIHIKNMSSTGGFICKNNVVEAKNHSPAHGIWVGWESKNGYVKNNIVTGSYSKNSIKDGTNSNSNDNNVTIEGNLEI